MALLAFPNQEEVSSFENRGAGSSELCECVCGINISGRSNINVTSKSYSLTGAEAYNGSISSVSYEYLANYRPRLGCNTSMLLPTFSRKNNEDFLLASKLVMIEYNDANSLTIVITSNKCIVQVLVIIDNDSKRTMSYPVGTRCGRGLTPMFLGSPDSKEFISEQYDQGVRY